MITDINEGVTGNMKTRQITACLLTLVLLVCSFGAGQAEPPVQTDGVMVPVIEDLKKFEIPENEAMTFLTDMKCGWNLGNTFDAHPDRSITLHASGTDMESSWVGVKTSRELIEAIHEAGFNTIRMPVSWHNHVDENDMIDADWMNRVKEVAGWALDLGMYVIVNTHHDNYKEFYYPDSEHYERSATYLSSVWKQMAEAFADRDEHLILESLNEPRLRESSQYQWSFNASAPECIDAAECINKLNQLFVDTVRATGGNNAVRYLAVTGYCASPGSVCSDLFVLPKDTADNRIIVSAHAYTPYLFALDQNRAKSTFVLDDMGQKSEIAQFMNNLYNKFIVHGIPVMLDEFGALDKDGNTQDRVNFAAYYTASASTRGITCVWWDNHVFSGSGERFGLIDRRDVKWVYPDIALAIVANCRYNRNTR